MEFLVLLTSSAIFGSPVHSWNDVGHAYIYIASVPLELTVEVNVADLFVSIMNS